MTKWTYSAQKGTPGHCFQAQVWDEKDQSIAVIESTKNPEDATAIAKLMSEAPEIKEQHEKMFELLKKCANHPYVMGDLYKKIKSIIKEIEK